MGCGGGWGEFGGIEGVLGALGVVGAIVGPFVVIWGRFGSI